MTSPTDGSDGQNSDDLATLFEFTANPEPNRYHSYRDYTPPTKKKPWWGRRFKIYLFGEEDAQNHSVLKNIGLTIYDRTLYNTLHLPVVWQKLSPKWWVRNRVHTQYMHDSFNSMFDGVGLLSNLSGQLGRRSGNYVDASAPSLDELAVSVVRLYESDDLERDIKKLAYNAAGTADLIHDNIKNIHTYGSPVSKKMAEELKPLIDEAYDFTDNVLDFTNMMQKIIKKHNKTFDETRPIEAKRTLQRQLKEYLAQSQARIEAKTLLRMIGTNDPDSLLNSVADKYTRVPSGEWSPRKKFSSKRNNGLLKAAFVRRLTTEYGGLGRIEKSAKQVNKDYKKKVKKETSILGRIFTPKGRKEKKPVFTKADIAEDIEHQYNLCFCSQTGKSDPKEMIDGLERQLLLAPSYAGEMDGPILAESVAKTRFQLLVTMFASGKREYASRALLRVATQLQDTIVDGVELKRVSGFSEGITTTTALFDQMTNDQKSFLISSAKVAKAKRMELDLEAMLYVNGKKVQDENIMDQLFAATASIPITTEEVELFQQTTAEAAYQALTHAMKLQKSIPETGRLGAFAHESRETMKRTFNEDFFSDIDTLDDRIAALNETEKNIAKVEKQQRAYVEFNENVQMHKRNIQNPDTQFTTRIAERSKLRKLLRNPVQEENFAATLASLKANRDTHRKRVAESEALQPWRVARDKLITQPIIEPKKAFWANPEYFLPPIVRWPVTVPIGAAKLGYTASTKALGLAATCCVKTVGAGFKALGGVYKSSRFVYRHKGKILLGALGLLTAIGAMAEAAPVTQDKQDDPDLNTDMMKSLTQDETPRPKTLENLQNVTKQFKMTSINNKKGISSPRQIEDLDDSLDLA